MAHAMSAKDGAAKPVGRSQVAAAVHGLAWPNCSFLQEGYCGGDLEDRPRRNRHLDRAVEERVGRGFEQLLDCRWVAAGEYVWVEGRRGCGDQDGPRLCIENDDCPARRWSMGQPNSAALECLLEQRFRRPLQRDVESYQQVASDGRLAPVMDGENPAAAIGPFDRDAGCASQRSLVGLFQARPPDPVSGMVGVSGENNRQLILRGLAGSGRHQAVVHGLASALGDRLSATNLVIYCPDVGTASRMHLAVRRRCPAAQPDIRVVAGGHLPPVISQTADDQPDRSGSVVVLAEAQRFSTEERYRLAQLGRPGLLLLTVDPFEMNEPWEHLFLTTPRVEEVIELTEQQRLAKRIWHEVRLLAPERVDVRGKTRRREKGNARAQWAANIDECLACMISEHESGNLADRVGLVAPLLEDVAYMGRRLAGRGWIPVFGQELDSLLLPGPLEFLAAVTDCVARTVGIGQRVGTAAATEQDTAGQDQSSAESPSLLRPVLDAAAAESYSAWYRRGAGNNPEITLSDFFESIYRSRWAASFLTEPSARDRVEQLLTDVGDETLVQFLDRPLWEAWWYEVLDVTGQDTQESRRPVVVLEDVAAGGGALMPATVYLCLGSEPAQLHYRVFGRVTEQLLVLYQECSPLPSQQGDESN